MILSKNQLQTTIPEWIGTETGWTNLEHLALDGNLLYGSIPASLGKLQNLRHLDLQVNSQLTGRFDEILFNGDDDGNAGPSQTLEFIDLSNTYLQGSLPATTLPSLRVIRLWNTRGLEGTIPKEVGTWSNLETFSVDDSPLVGTIPTEFGLLENLKTLEIQGSNSMSGTLPTELGGNYLSNGSSNSSSSNLKVLSFALTNRTGTLPAEWSTLTNLESLDVKANAGLTGTIPTEYAMLTNLNNLDLRATDLTGEVSEEICEMNIEDLFTDCSTKTDDSYIVCVCCIWCND